MATRTDLSRRLDALAATLWNLGADFPVPVLQQTTSGVVGFELSALLPGPPPPLAPEIAITERWSPDGRDRFRLREYAYEFIERPLDRRRAFHRHDDAWFLEHHAVTVHEHCEEVIGAPACSHYFGLPIDPFEAIQRFLVQWGQAEPLGCADLRCMA